MGFFSNSQSGCDRIRREVKADAKKIEKGTNKKVPRHERERETVRRMKGKSGW